MKLQSYRRNQQLGGSHCRQTGLSILEVLIALAVLSIGLAGLAIMHLNSLKYAHSAYYRSIASTVALDLEERLWLRIADTTVVDCPDTSTAGTAYTSLSSDWNRTAVSTSGWPGFGTNRAKIRNLTITPGTLNYSTFAEIPVTLAWTESRFDDTTDTSITDESSTEQFVYTVRILCKFSSTGSLPPEPTT